MFGYDTIIVLGHGSRSPEATAQFREVVGMVRDESDVPVLEAFMENAEPTLGDAVDEAVAGGATEIAVLPLFLFTGIHIQRDIPELIAEIKGAHPSVTLDLRAPLGVDARIAEVLIERLGDDR